MHRRAANEGDPHASLRHPGHGGVSTGLSRSAQRVLLSVSHSHRPEHHRRRPPAHGPSRMQALPNVQDNHHSGAVITC